MPRVYKLAPSAQALCRRVHRAFPAQSPRDAKRLGYVLPAAQSRRGQHGKPILVAALSLLLLGGSKQAGASLLWEWNYTGPGVSASGIFTTDDKPDTDGFYHIIDITGTADGGRITGLQAAGTAIPGNSGFPVDNLVTPTEPQLTMHGFGFLVSNGNYHNPFFDKNYLDYISLPPYVDGAGRSRQSTSMPWNPSGSGEPVRPHAPCDRARLGIASSFVPRSFGRCRELMAEPSLSFKFAVIGLDHRRVYEWPGA